jgi:hypothetical protein
LKIKVLFAILAVLLSTSCKQLAFGKYARRMTLSFGQSGGFTGAKSEYILTGKGQLFFIKEFTPDTSLLMLVPKNDIKRIFKLADSKNLKKIEMNTTGNMNRFIYLYCDGKHVKTWQWAEGTDIPEELKELNTRLNKLNQP